MKGAVPVGVGTRFIYDGEMVTIVEMFPSAHGNEVLVANSSGKQRFWMALRELLASGRASIVSDDDGPRSDDAVEVASVVLSNLTEAARAIVSEMADHVREVLTGYKSGTAELGLEGEPHPQFLPRLSVGERCHAKADELHVSERTVRRWISRYQTHGEAGLATLRKGEPFGWADQRWVTAAAEIMVEHNALSKPSRLSVIHQTHARMQVTHGPGVVPLPSRATAYRVLNTLEHQFPTFKLSTKRNRDIAGRPPGVYGRLRPSRPGEYLVMDSTVLDVFALDPVTLKWVGVELTVAMDWYTRCITGLRLTPKSTKAIDVAAVLYQTYKPNPAPAYWPSHAVWPEHGVPRVVFPAVEALAVNNDGACNPVIIPDTLVIDHGKSFESQHISSVCQRLGISIQPARLRTGRDKGVVERFFRTLREDLLQVLPGYKGPDVYSRGESPELDAFFYLDELEDIIREWVAVVYHHRPHDSLVDPKVPGLKMSPAERFQHGIERAGFIEAPRDPDLAFEFLKPVRRKILHYGVQYQGRRYNGPGLNGYRNEDSPYTGPARRRWFIHVNPDDITRVYFRDPIDRTWHTLLWDQAPSLHVPMSEDAVAFARRLAAARGAPVDPRSAMEALLERWNLGVGDSRAERRIALRLSRERAGLIGDLSTVDDETTVASLTAFRAATSSESESSAPAGEPPEPDDDLDALVDDDADDDVSDDDFYADAFEDQ